MKWNACMLVGTLGLLWPLSAAWADFSDNPMIGTLYFTVLNLIICFDCIYCNFNKF